MPTREEVYSWEAWQTAANIINCLCGSDAECTPPTITTTDLGDFDNGVFFSRILSYTGSTPTWAVTAGALPTGMALDSVHGMVSGTPTGGGAYNFTVTATNGCGSDDQQYTGDVGCVSPVWVTEEADLPDPVKTIYYSYQLIASGTASITYTVSAGTLPAGLDMSENGLITGTPSSSGVANFTVRASNVCGTADLAFTVTCLDCVAPDLNEDPTGAWVSEGTVGEAYIDSFQFLNITGDSPYTFHASGLPTGLRMFQSGADEITLTSDGLALPGPAGEDEFTIWATNECGVSDTIERTFTVAEGCTPPTILEQSPPAGTVGVAYSYQILATGSATIVFNDENQDYPPGLSVNQDGLISGTPTTEGTYYNWHICADNGCGARHCAEYNISIAPATQYIYFGKNASADANEAAILGLSSNAGTNFPGSYNYSAGASLYAYFAYPAAWGEPSSLMIGAFDWNVNDQAPYTLGSIPRTYKEMTVSGVTYKVFRSLYTTSGAFTLVAS